MAFLVSDKKQNGKNEVFKKTAMFFLADFCDDNNVVDNK